MPKKKNDPKRVDIWTRQLWDYLRLHQEIKPADAIFVLGSHDLHVPERAAEVYKAGLATTVLISGGINKVTDKIWERPEAQVFADIMEKLGVPRLAMVLDTTALDTGENVIRMQELVEERGIAVSSLIIVCQPYMERRGLATVRQLWPEIELVVTSPSRQYDDYVQEYQPGELTHVLVGQVQRLSEYTKLGWITAEPLPAAVRQVWHNLIAAGFTDNLVSSDLNI